MSYDYEYNFIGGMWVPTESKTTLEVENPYTLEKAGKAPLSSKKDVEKAVAAACEAFSTWRSSPIDERIDVLRRMREIIAANIEELAQLWTLEVGTPITTSRQAASFLPIKVIQDLEENLQVFKFERVLGETIVHRIPIGPIAAITPWNYPIGQLVTKCASAIAAGCTVVAKPSAIAPLCGFRIMELISNIRLPSGVINIVGGDGTTTGEALVRNKDIRLVSFTGSTEIGRHIAEVCGQRIVKTCLELGGKSASIVLDREILPSAVASTVASCTRNSGQTCTSLTRLIVMDDFLEEANEIAVQSMSRLPVGNPNDPETQIGPLISAEQRRKALKLIRIGLEEGAKRIFGHPQDSILPEIGYFVPPTVFTDVTSRMRIAQEEIFAPVLSIMSAKNREDAIHLANDSTYGLAGTVWSSSHEMALSAAKQIDAGTLTVNTGAFNPSAPYGGMRDSGLGRELGVYGMEEYLEFKTYHGGYK